MLVAMLHSTESVPMATVSWEQVQTHDPSKAPFHLPRAFDRSRQHACETPSLHSRMCWGALSPSSEWLHHGEDTVAVTSHAQAARGRESTQITLKAGRLFRRTTG